MYYIFIVGTKGDKPKRLSIPRDEDSLHKKGSAIYYPEIHFNKFHHRY